MRDASRIVPLADGHHVWTRRVGESKTKLLLLHGGPGFNHEYLEIFADYLPQHGVELYFYDQLGPNEFLVTGNFKDWDRWADLHRLQMPTLLLVGQHDTMAVEDIEEMGQRIPNSHVTVCPNGSHMAMWDNADIYFASLLHFVDSVETGGK